MKRLLIGGLLCVFAVIMGCTSPVNSRQDTVDSRNTQSTISNSESKIETLIQQLGNDDWQTREKAQGELENIGEPAEPMLKDVAQGSDPEIKSRANRILRFIAVKKRITFSPRLLKEFPNLYYDLTKLDTADKFKLLVQITSRDNKGNYKYGNIVTNTDIAGLIGEVLLENDQKLTLLDKQLILQISMGKYTEDEARKLGPLTGGWYTPVHESVPHIMKFLNDNDEEIRLHAANTIGILRAKEAIPELIKLLKDNDKYVRGSAISALGKIGAKGTIPDMIKLLTDSEHYIRFTSADALAELGAKEAIPQIIELLKDDDQIVRGSVIFSLVKLDAKESVPELRKLLKKEFSYIGGYAALALAKFGAKDAIPEIINLLYHENINVRKDAAISLVKLGAKDKVPEKIIKDIKDIITETKAYDSQEDAKAVLKELGVTMEEEKK